MVSSDPKHFAEWFNHKYPGAYRQITYEDVKDMTDCGLIYRHKCYSGSEDGETIRGVLQYEQLRENRSLLQDKEKKPPTCRRCRQPLPPNPEDNSGRHKEYCSNCEPQRNRERQKKLMHRRRK